MPSEELQTVAQPAAVIALQARRYTAVKPKIRPTAGASSTGRNRAIDGRQ
jgi:hypothetical protein